MWTLKNHDKFKTRNLSVGNNFHLVSLDRQLIKAIRIVEENMDNSGILSREELVLK